MFSISCVTIETPKKSPVTPVSTSAKKGYYTVKRGDSLWKIAKAYGVSSRELMRVNKINSPRSLKSGHKLLIPARQSKKINGFCWPVQGQVVNFFQESVDGLINKGLNIQTGQNDKTARASAPGKVVYSKELKGWGKTVILKHESNIYTIYANLDKSLVKEGRFLSSKDQVGQIACGADGKYV